MLLIDDALVCCQSVNGDVLSRMNDLAVHFSKEGFKAVSMVTGDSMYTLVPWDVMPKTTRDNLMLQRIEFVARKYHAGDLSMILNMKKATGLAFNEESVKIDLDGEGSKEDEGARISEEAVVLEKTLLAILKGHQYTVFVTDAESSDLVISDPARAITDVLSWCIAPGEDTVSKSLYQIAGQYFRDLMSLPWERDDLWCFFCTWFHQDGFELMFRHLDAWLCHSVCPRAQVSCANMAPPLPLRLGLQLSCGFWCYCYHVGWQLCVMIGTCQSDSNCWTFHPHVGHVHPFWCKHLKKLPIVEGEASYTSHSANGRPHPNNNR